MYEVDIYPFHSKDPNTFYQIKYSRNDGESWSLVYKWLEFRESQAPITFKTMRSAEWFVRKNIPTLEKLDIYHKKLNEMSRAQKEYRNKSLRLNLED